jgi:hypothetical protein
MSLQYYLCTPMKHIKMFSVLALVLLISVTSVKAQHVTKNHFNITFGSSLAVGAFAAKNPNNNNSGYASYWTAFTAAYQRELIPKHLFGLVQLNYFSNKYNNAAVEDQLNPNSDKSKGNVYSSSTAYISKYLMLGVGTGIVNKAKFNLIGSLKFCYGLFQPASYNFVYSDGKSAISSAGWASNEYTPMLGLGLDARFKVYKNITFNVVLDYYMFDIKIGEKTVKTGYSSGFNSGTATATASYKQKFSVINSTFGFGYNF